MQAGDVQRLIQIIVEEFAALERQGRPERCACHSVLYECCPERLRGVLDAGATRLGLHATGGATGSVAGMIDHTLLKPDATRKDIEALCRGGGVQVRERVRESDMGEHMRPPAAGNGRSRVFGRRVSARGHHGRRQALRDAAGDL
jgi:hypothetical protein